MGLGTPQTPSDIADSLSANPWTSWFMGGGTGSTGGAAVPPALNVGGAGANYPQSAMQTQQLQQQQMMMQASQHPFAAAAGGAMIGAYPQGFPPAASSPHAPIFQGLPLPSWATQPLAAEGQQQQQPTFGVQAAKPHAAHYPPVSGISAPISRMTAHGGREAIYSGSNAPPYLGQHVGSSARVLAISLARA